MPEDFSVSSQTPTNCRLPDLNGTTKELFAGNDIKYSPEWVDNSRSYQYVSLLPNPVVGDTVHKDRKWDIPGRRGSRRKSVQFSEFKVTEVRKMLVSQLPTHPPVTLEFSDLTYSVRDSPSRKFGGLGPYQSKQMKTIIDGASGIFKPGELTAIMGPSGAGKSTLMNLLAGYKTTSIKGDISVNGVTRELQRFRKMSCYIMQDDVLLMHLTVAEAMGFAAQLKLPRKMIREKKMEVISEILEIIGLTGCKDTKTSSLSGGQRKRLAIALELVNNPPIMFFDEPTSGLDSVTCYSCVTLLKALAEGGRTIIATIHQPSARIFEQFDSLYLLAAGKCLYRGPVRSVVPFLARQGLNCPPYHNPADFAIEVASGDYGEHWLPILAKATALSSDSDSSGLDNDYSERNSTNGSETGGHSYDTVNVDQVRQHGCKETVVALLPSQLDTTVSYTIDDESWSPKFWNQFLTLLKRSFLCVSRDMMLTHLRFASTILVGLLIGAIYHDAGNDASKTFNNGGNLFFGLLFIVFSSMMTTVLTFPLERGVLVREHLNCWYSLKSYFLARTMADLPFQLFFPTLYMLITYFMTEQPHESFRFFIACGMAILIGLVAQSIGLLIGAACSVTSSVFIGPISTIPVFLFSGFFVTLNTVPAYIRWVSSISYAKYAFQSTLTAVYGFNREELKCTEVFCLFKSPAKFLEQLDCVDVNVGLQAIYLVVILLVCRILSYWTLRFKIMSERR